MSRDTLRFTLLASCLVAAVLDAMVVTQPGRRLLLGVLLLGVSVVALRMTGEKRTTGGTRKSLRELLPQRGPSLRQEVEALRQVTSELALKLSHHDGLRQAMWTTLDGRLTEVETAQEHEVPGLRESREKHQLAVGRVQERLDAHKRELAALAQVLNAPEPVPAQLSEPRPSAPAAAEQVAPLPGTAASAF